MRIRFLSSLLCLFACSTRHTCNAQALPTATGPGSYIAVGGGASSFDTDYGHNHIVGGFALLDVNLTWRVALEGEARWLRSHLDQQTTQSTYLGGVQVVVWPRPSRWSPYAKFLAGTSRITLPYAYAHGSFAAYGSGAGVDFALSDRVSVRTIDFEYQRWPDFPYGGLHPYGVSAGVKIRLNHANRYPRM